MKIHLGKIGLLLIVGMACQMGDVYGQYCGREMLQTKGEEKAAIPVIEKRKRAPVKVKFIGRPKESVGTPGESSPESLHAEARSVQLAGGEALPPEIRIFPNPTHTNATLEIAVAEPLLVEIRLFDSNGRDLGTVVPRHEFSGTSRFLIDLTNLPAGMYFVQGIGGNVRISERIVKI